MHRPYFQLKKKSHEDQSDFNQRPKTEYLVLILKSYSLEYRSAINQGHNIRYLVLGKGRQSDDGEEQAHNVADEVDGQQDVDDVLLGLFDLRAVGLCARAHGCTKTCLSTSTAKNARNANKQYQRPPNIASYMSSR